MARRLNIPHTTVRNYYFDRIPAPEVLIKIADEMSVLTDRFGRSDTRTFVKLVVLQGFMAPDPKPLARGGAGIGVKPYRRRGYSVKN